MSRAGRRGSNLRLWLRLVRGDPLSKNLAGIQGILRAGALAFSLLLPACRFGPCLWRAGFWAIKKSKSKKN